MSAVQKFRWRDRFQPRWYQERALRYFGNGGKRAVTVWHRRSGKDLTAAQHTCHMAHIEIGQYWHFFPTFELGRRTIWEGFTKDGRRFMELVFPGFLDPKMPGSLVKRKNDQQMFLELHCGSIWRLMGTDKVENVGAGPKGLVLSEFALCRPTVWDYLRPMLRESGGWAWFLTTPRGKNHAYELFEQAGAGSGWFRDVKTVLDTGLAYASNRNPELTLTPQQMIEEERLEGMQEALIQQEYMCDWTAALVGSVWGDLLQKLEAAGGMDEFETPPGNVYATFDIGIDDNCSIWLWRLNHLKGVDFVHHYTSAGQPASHYLDWLDDQEEEHGFKVAKVFLPHDAKQRSFQTGASVVDQFVARLGVHRVALTPTLSLVDGIHAGRWLLQKPCRFSPRTALGLKSLKAYHYAYDDRTKTLSRVPFHDWSSHDADGFRYVACVVRRAERAEVAVEKKAEPVVREAGSFTLDELIELEQRAKARRSRA